MAMMLINLPDGRMTKYSLDPGVHVMGRDPSCDIVLDDPSASRQHAVVRCDGPCFALEDLGSKNGTLVNHRRIATVDLCHLDEILIGSVEVKFISEESVAAKRASTVVVADGEATVETAEYTSKSANFELNQRRLEMLYDLSERLLTLRDTQGLLEEAMSICFETLRFERGAIAVRKAGERTVDWPVVRNLRSNTGELTISRSVLGRAMDFGERAVVTDAGGQRVDPTVSMVQHGIRTALCVPLKHGDAVLGVIYGDRTTTGTHYSKEELDFLAALAGQVTIGLINARLLEEQKSKLALEKEIDLAREIQQGLFPRVLPRHDGIEFAVLNEPGRTVSGDYYDIVPLDKNRFGFVVADVTGKGVASALLMSNLQAAVRLSLPSSDDLGGLVARWNDLIYTNTDATKFITCLTGIVDVAKRSLKFVAAGHQPPYLVLGERSLPKVMHVPADFPLGVVDDATYTARTFELGAEPCVVFCYTDGVSEAMDPNENLFGEPEMEKVLAACGDLDAHTAIKRMRKAVTSHCRDAAQSDDITMLAFHIK